MIDAFWSEPDHWSGIENGFVCHARRNPMKAWCGYVGVPESHPLYGKDYCYRVEVSDRGAIPTEGRGMIPLFFEALHEDDGKVSLSCFVSCHGGLTYANTGWPADDGLWYFGFDCSHSGDLTPKAYYDYTWPLRDGEYRTLAFVQAEIARLAKELRTFG